MDLQKLKENIVTKEVDLFGEKLTLEIQPYAETPEDCKNVETVLAKLKGWNFELNGKPLEITEENLSPPVMPDEFFLVILDAIQAVKRAPLGKLEVLTA